jgi:hypothetical protein
MKTILGALMVACTALEAGAQGLALPDLPSVEQRDDDALLKALATFGQGMAQRDGSRRLGRDRPSASSGDVLAQSNLPPSALPPSAGPLSGPLSGPAFAAGGLAFSQNSFSMSTADSRFRIGGGAAYGGVSSRIEYARLIDERMALGGSVQLGEHQSELVGRGVFLNRDKDLEFDAAFSFMRGRPLFDFDSGSERASVSQFSGLASLRHKYAPQDGLGLHSFGVSVWGGSARSSNNLQSKTLFTETADYSRTLYDPRRISAGSLRGSSVDLQYAPLPSLVLGGSIGMEQTRYPMANGTRENQRRPYLAASLKAELPNQSILDLRLSSGFAREFGVGLSHGAYRLSMGVSRGRDGGQSNKAIMLSVDLARIFWPQKKELDGPALAIRESLQRFSSAALLDKAATRPSQLPQNFLAKVDRTAVKVIEIDKAGLPPGAKLSDDKKSIQVPVSSSALTIVDIRQNGANFPSSGPFNVSAGSVTVDLTALRPPAQTDAYVVRVKDLQGSIYDVKFLVGSKPA